MVAYPVPWCGCVVHFVFLSERERLSLLHDGIPQSFNFLEGCESQGFGACNTGEKLRRNAYGVDSFYAVYLANGYSDLHGVFFQFVSGLKSPASPSQ